MKAVFSTASLPTIEFFSMLLKCDEIILNRHEHYQKQCNRNRYHILSPNGIQMLQIPVKHTGMYQAPISDIRISYAENWQTRHIRSIEAAYNSSPFYEYYKDSFKEVFFCKEEFLFDYNLRLLQYCLIKMKAKVAINSFLFSKEELNSFQNFKTISNSKNTQIIFQELFEAKKYNQVFSYKFGFIQNLSIIDLLFNTGPDVLNYI